jgi:hypothetical protein
VNPFTDGIGIGHFVMAITGSMTALILKRGKLSRSSGQWQDEDYDVLENGKVVGGATIEIRTRSRTNPHSARTPRRA